MRDDIGRHQKNFQLHFHSLVVFSNFSVTFASFFSLLAFWKRMDTICPKQTNLLGFLMILPWCLAPIWAETL